MRLIKFISGNFTGFRKSGVGLFQPVFKQLKKIPQLELVAVWKRFLPIASLPGSVKPGRMRTRFKILDLFYVGKIVKNSFFVTWCILALSLNTSCTPSPSNETLFDKQEGRTIHDIDKFLLPVSVELQMESEKVESNEESGKAGVVSAPVPGASASGDKKLKRQLKTVDWLQAPLKEKHLKKLGALRIKTVSKGEPVKNSTSQLGASEDTYSRVPFNTQYYRLDYEFLDVNLPPQTNLDSIKENQEKLWAFLLGRDIENFYGFPDTVYYILPHVESNYLILYRLGLPDTIPYDQRPLARRVGDFLATPLIGYPVKYCLSEKDKNEYGEITDQSTPYCEGIPLDSAKYVNFETDKEHKKPFEYEDKLDLFPADFFNGDWFYLRTEIQSGKRTDNKTISDPSFQTAHLVEFQKKSTHLAVMDSSQYGLDEKDREPILFIPVNWKEYEMNRDLDFFNSFGEREKKPAGKDVERPYFLLDFQQFKSLEKSRFSSGTTYTVKNVLVTEDFVSFNIETNRKGGSSTVVKYSFRRAADNLDYPQKQWYEADSSTFHPVSYIEQKHYKTPLHHTKADKERFYRMTRFNPDQEEILWYFSTQTPKDDWVRDFGRQAIAYENRVFQEAGKYSPRTIKVRLEEKDGDKELGDTRYNIINLVVTETSGPTAFGVGSHVAHPMTGEIISATANVWVSHIVDKDYVPLVRQYIRFHIWPLPWKLLPSSPGVTSFIYGKIHKLCPEVTKFIADNKGVVPPLHPVNSKDALDDGGIQIQCARKMARTHILYEVIQAIRHGHGFRHVFSASADTEHHYKSYDEIKDLFGDVEEIHNSPFPSWEDNLIKDQKTPPYYSSVMDHITIDFPILSVPGKYDIAATRYLYFDQLETIDEKDVVDGYVTLSSGDKSIKQELSAGPVLFTDLESNQSRKTIDEGQVKTYYVCGGKNRKRTNPDEHTEDPFCTPWDYGRTPKEVVINKITAIKHDIMLYSRRYDSDIMPESFPISHPQHLTKFTRKWSKLRNQALSAVGKSIFDFSAFIDSDIEAYTEIIEKAIEKEKARYQLQMTEAEKAKCEKSRSSSTDEAEHSECTPYSDLEAYSEIIPLLADFYQELLFIPPKQCVYQKESAAGISYRTVAVEVVKARVKNIYPEGSTEALFSCQSEAFKKWVDERDLGRFIAEVGGFSHAKGEVKYLIQPPADDPGDEFALHNIYNKIQERVRFVILEPDIRKVFFQRVRDFWLKGYDLNPYLDGVSLRETLGLSAEEALPRLPRFPSYEITDLIPNARQNQFRIMAYLENRQEIMELGKQLDKVPWQLRVHHDLLAEDDPSGLKFQLSQLTEGNDDPSIWQYRLAQFIEESDNLSALKSQLSQFIEESDNLSAALKSQLSQFIEESDDLSTLKSHLSQIIEENPDQATLQISSAYKEYLPFVHQAYQRYIRDYNTPEKRQSTPFPEYFVNLPSVLSLFNVGGDILYIPFDERSLWTGLFRKYDEYKTCLKAAEEEVIDAITGVGAIKGALSQEAIDMKGQGSIPGKVEAEASELEKIAAGCKEDKEKEAYIKLIDGFLKEGQTVEQ